ncbi:hypothetical protein [Sulfuracidifex tepidarius]|uniref:VapB-type antitoxin n=1 Tax=Sulfuracidifex tepidarius TaxID=1294262 RepID=A0A510DT10_9CREN|nr:hypothetical protein [Sulfuracidifex tepidarius]BBG23270.1 hypothetical protein IC006_0554 [Sulfuracidifex tepidarius]BBG26021.1 hypothetical protein IC007_0526 [Sulfuracidifex tepidarius]
MKSTVSVSKEVKELLEKEERDGDKVLDKSLTWDEFFREVFKPEEPPKLTEEEARS